VKPRVVFFANGGFHSAVLRPIMDELKGRLDVQPATEAHEAGRLKPTILVVASHKRLEWFRWKLPETWICSVRHGLVGKRGIEHLPDRDSARRFDSVCVGDQTTIDRYLRNRAAPQEMWLTGFPQMDPLFRRDRAPDLGLDRSRPVILFAPTWNPQMSSTPLLGAEVADLILGPRSAPSTDGTLVLKAHPTTAMWNPEWLTTWAQAAAADPRITVLAPTTDVTGVMLAADLMISDASSTIFEYLALDRPMVLITTPDAASDIDYDPYDLPWRWRDVGDEVTDRAVLASVVADALAHPTRRAAERLSRRNELFGDLQDGQNARRVADRLVDLAARMRSGKAPPALRFASLPRGGGSDEG